MGSFSAQERFLIEKTEEAIRDGVQLERWCRDSDREGKLKLFDLNLKKKFRVPNKAQGFFGALEISGKSTSVMGCIQDVDFGRLEGPGALKKIEDFVCGQFLPRANWKYPDGYPGGFTIEQSLHKLTGGGYARFAGTDASGCIDWRRLGKDFDWVLLTVGIHDFVMDFGPYRKRFKEAACVSPCPQFLHIVERPAPGIAHEVSIGYPFVAFAPIPNVFGFGPGKFGAAVKLFSFLLTDDNRLRVRMYFAAAPRCAKVFDFSPGFPDPIYGGARLLRRLSFGAFDD
ncbi:MAG: hypothetical protein ACRD8O_00570, partial [Bryobacteraceae bacterium]